MKTNLTSIITGTMPTVQDLLADVSVFVPDCDSFKTVVTGANCRRLLSFSITADQGTIAEIMEVIDASNMEQVESNVSQLKPETK